MLKAIIFYINILILLISFYSCQKKTNLEATNVVKEWINREIKFDNDYIFTRLGKDSLYNLRFQSEYKILVYTDSIGCVGCNLRLPQWMEWMKQIDSISNGKVSFLFFIHPKDETDLQLLLQRQNFNIPVCIDKDNSLNKLNHFPTNAMLQTFLLDEHNKVLAIGNPMHSLKIKDLYMNIIFDKKKNSERGERKQTKIMMDKESIDMGTFDWHEEQVVYFVLLNMGKECLVIDDVTTSCGCTTVEYPKEPIRPGQKRSLKVKYKSDRPEHFNKTITIYCNTTNSPLRLEISGNAK